MQTSYQGIREQLVSLTVELEDKSKVAVMLESKVKQERELLSQVDHHINTQYESQLQQILSEQQQTMEEHKNKINQLITNKKSIIDNCKLFVEEIKTLDSEGRTKLQELTAHAKQVIEQDKKAFKSNSEERQKQVSRLLGRDTFMF